MQMLHGRPDRERTIIIVAPPSAVIRVVRRSSANDAMAFCSADEFETWAAAHPNEPVTIRRELMVALAQVGCAESALSRRLRRLLEWIGDRPCVPKLSEVSDHCQSRRSFYRNWSAEIDEPPSAFLRRIRALHAARLLSDGLTRKKAAVAAGFTSVDQMRRHLRQ